MTTLRTTMVLLATAGALLAPTTGLRAQTSPAAQPPVLPVEESDVAVLPPAGPHRVFAFAPFGGGGAVVLEADDPAIVSVGTVPTAGNAVMTLSRDAAKVYVAETYWSHGNRGDRADLLSVYDGRTLNLEKEIPLPGRLHIVPKIQQLALSDDDKLAYVYDMVPSSAVHVVDVAAGALLTSVDIPGCALAYPYGARSFATVCGDGTIGTATLPASGKAKINFSPRVFDPDADPVYENSIVDRTTGEGWFLSYSGKIYPARLGEKPVIDKPWSITQAAGMPVTGVGVQELAWRPGGGQLMALHRATKRLYVLMHPGAYWTHKESGTEVWVLDSEKHSLIRRIPLSDPAKNIAVTQDAKPLLFVFGADGGPAPFKVLDADTGKVLRTRSASLAMIAMTPGL